MRAALLIISVITLLIVGILVIKDVNTGPEKDVKKTEMVKKAKEAADVAEDAMKKLNQRIKDAEQ